MRTTVVGRVDEVAVLRERAGRAAAGQGAIILLSGEPGAGKSTLLAVAAAEGRRHGARILRAAAPADGSLPFAAIGSWLDADLAIGAAGAGEADRDAAVAEAVVNRVHTWCADGPVVLLVDDLQWADPSSLLVLGRIARAAGRLPLLLVAAYQPAPRRAELDALLRVLRGHGAVSVPLGPLPGEDIAALAGALAGGRPDPRLRELLAGAGGNPRYATEVLGALARTGRLRVAGGVATLRRDRDALPVLPGTLRDLIRRRLRRLSPGCLELLQAAAVLGPGTDLTDLAAILDTPVLSLWQPVDEAVAAGLLVNAESQDARSQGAGTQDAGSQDAGSQLVFRHDLVRRVIAADRPPAITAAMRARAGRALVTAGAPVERIARHLVAAPGLAPDMVDWVARAADALVPRAPDLAVELLARIPAQHSTDDLRLAHARALLWAGRAADAELAVKAALGGGTRAAALHWLLVQAYLHLGRVGDALAGAEEALAAGGLNEVEAARFHGFAAQCLLLAGRPDAADAAAEHALAVPDNHATACGLTVRAGVELARGRPEAALALADKALATLGGEPVRPDRQLTPHLVRGFCLLRLDRYAEADAAFDDGRTHSERAGDAFLAWHHLGRARVRYLDGRWDGALAEIRAGLDRPDRLGAHDALRSQAALIAMHRGDFDTYADLLAGGDASLAGRYWEFLRGTARALDREAAGQANHALEALLDAWEHGPDPGCLAPDLARVAARTAQLLRLRRVADEFDRIAGDDPAPHQRAGSALCRGVATGDPALLLDAADAYATAGQPLHRGYAYETAAAMLADRGEAAEARAALDAAVECYERLGATWDLERARARLRRFGIRYRNVRHRPKTGWDALTDTERRIAALVVEGRSNPDIAVELYLSRRTVRNHVSHILAKLGLSSRVELAVSAYDRHSAQSGD